jgi:putative phosphoesterase
MGVRIGLIGDVHHEDLALAWALGQLSDSGVDLVVCAGDIADGYGNLDACCELLESHGVVTVRGNHDRWFLAKEMRDVPLAAAHSAATALNRQWLSELPTTVSIETPAGRALLCHGLGDNDMMGLKPDDNGYALESNEPLQRLLADGAYAIVIAGHTHQPMLRRLGGVTFVNAGTLHRDYHACYGVFDVLGSDARFFPIPNLARGT